MAKSDSTTFKSIVQAIPAIAGAYRPQILMILVGIMS